MLKRPRAPPSKSPASISAVLAARPCFPGEALGGRVSDSSHTTPRDGKARSSKPPIYYRSHHHGRNDLTRLQAFPDTPPRSRLLSLEQQDGAVSEVEVDEVLGLCRVRKLAAPSGYQGKELRSCSESLPREWKGSEMIPYHASRNCQSCVPQCSAMSGPSSRRTVKRKRSGHKSCKHYPNRQVGVGTGMLPVGHVVVPSS